MNAGNLALDRRSFAWCAAAACAAMLPLVQTLPGWLVGLLAVLAALGAGFGWSGRQLSPWVRLPLTLGVAGVVLYTYGFRFGRDTGAALLVSMLALKLLETRRLRDARSALSFALFAVMAGFLQTQSPLTLLLALGALLLLLSALGRVAEAEFGDAAAATPVRRRLLGAGRLVLVSLPLALVGFLFFPRLGAPLWGLPENVAQARTGLGDEMSPGDISSLYLDDTPVMRVLFDGPPPAQNELYWRGPVLSVFDGRRWIRDGLSQGLEAPPLEPLGPPIGYQVTQEPTDRRFLMVLDVPVSPPPGARMNADRSVTTRRVQSQLAQYAARSYTRYRFEPELSELLRRRAVTLPTGYNPRTAALIQQWRAESPSDEALIRRALAWFNREFTYTLSPQLLGRDSIDDFLFQTREGYCEHFASAFVVMMRQARIPARVVTGYQGGRNNGVGGYWVVRQSDAHAWAEVWLPGEGWVRVDPTSAVAPERIRQGAQSLSGPETLWDRYSRPIFDAGDWMRRNWNDLVLGFNAVRQRALLQPLGVPYAGTTELGVALAVSVALALAITLAILLRAPRAARDPLQRAWRRFVRRLARAGVEKPPHEGAVAFGARAAHALPHAADQIVALSGRYARRRYAANVLEGEADQALCDALSRFRVPSASPSRSPS